MRGNRDMVLREGDEWVSLISAERTGDARSADLLMSKSGPIQIDVDVTAVGAPAGQIDQIIVKEKNGDNYDAVHSFTGLAINATGRYRFLIHPEAVGLTGYTAVIQGIAPKIFEVVVDNANESDSITYSLKVTALGQ